MGQMSFRQATLRILYIIITIITIGGCRSCKEEVCDDSTNPECPNYKNPCDGAVEVTAAIEISEQAQSTVYDEIFIIADIVKDDKNIRFRCPIDGAISYTWHLGAEVIHEQEFVRYFSGFAGQDIPVTLIIQKQPNTSCFPNDDGIDTLTKMLHIVDPCEPSLEGNYRGAWDDMPLDSFEVALFAAEGIGDPIGECHGFFISNFSKDNPSPIDVSGEAYWSTNYRMHLYSGLASLDSFQGEFYLDEDQQTLLVDYKLYVGNGLFETHVFRGYKIN